MVIQLKKIKFAKRIRTANRTQYSLHKYFLNKEEIFRKTKIIIYLITYLPMITYVAENQILINRLDKRLQAVMKYLRVGTGAREMDEGQNEDIDENKFGLGI